MSVFNIEKNNAREVFLSSLFDGHVQTLLITELNSDNYDNQRLGNFYSKKNE